MILEKVLDKIANLELFYERDLIHDLFSWKELESLLNLRPFVNADRFTIINNQRYTWGRENWLTDVNTYPPDLIQSEIKKYVCYLRDCSRVNSKVNNLCGELESITDFPTDAHIYFAAENVDSPGFSIHHDFSHNLIVQVEGESRFQVWGKTKDISQPRYSIDEMTEPPRIDVIMKPGDAIFIPLHYMHYVQSMTKRLSISFPLTPQKGHPQTRHWISIT